MPADIPHSIAKAPLWQRTLAARADDEDGAARDSLRHTFLAFREKAGTVAGEVAGSLPNFTVHDLTHIDALWETASVIIGDDFALTPAEGFVLGGAFLLHDLGLALSAYPGGIDELKRHPQWGASLAAAAESHSTAATPQQAIEDPPEEAVAEATVRTLQLLHASRAPELVHTLFKHRPQDEAEYLIDDARLRNMYGHLIGQIAYSHWWPVSDLHQLGPSVGAPSDCPSSWEVDPVKLACILRVADACQIDERRAPRFLRAVRSPTGSSEEHWVFQEYLQKVRRDQDRLIFTSARPFLPSDASAWWQCFDSVQVADRELHDVDGLLADSGRPRFAASQVAGAGDPIRLSNHVRVENWTPIDTQIRVGNVVKLVEQLGGTALYGDDPTVPLRELIQNAADAVRARREKEKRGEHWGQIRVKLGSDSHGEWLEVADTGIGMSEEVLCGALLDFGNSYWNSPQFQQEHPELAQTGFRSTGKYGLGFFSVFMIGRRVRVTTRRALDGQADTRILEFEAGLRSRPLLRQAKESETLVDPGTMVRVWLNTPAKHKGGVLGPEAVLRVHHHNFDHYDLMLDAPWSLCDICAWLAPCCDVDIVTSELDAPYELSVQSDDWRSMDGTALLHRLSEPYPSEPGRMEDLIAANLRLISDDSGAVIGRASIAPDELFFIGEDRARSISGVGTAGLFRASTLLGFAGVFLGGSSRASRDETELLVSESSLATWAREQVALLVESDADPRFLCNSAAIARWCGAETGELPICETRAGWQSSAQVEELACHLDEVIIVQDAALSLARRHHSNITLLDNVISVSTALPGVTLGSDWDWPESFKSVSTHTSWRFHRRSLKGQVWTAIAAGWRTTVDTLLANSQISSDEASFDRVIARSDGGNVTRTVDVLRRPETR